MAAALNEAYARAEPIDAMLSHHRLLALARAPLADRLRLMRHLAEVDIAGTYWDEDIRVFERARIAEIRSQLPQLARAGNAGGCRQIQEELAAPSWRELIPPELTRAVGDVSARVRAASGAMELRKLLPALNEAYAAMAYEQTRDLLGKWLAIATDTQLELPSDLEEQVAPIKEWVSGQRKLHEIEAEFQTAQDRLQQLIDTGAPLVELESGYEQVRRFDREIPHRLEERYRQRAEYLLAKARHRRVVTYSAIAAAFLVVAAITIIITYQAIRTREAKDTALALRQAQAEVEAGDANRGQLLLSDILQQHLRIAGNPVVIAAASNLRHAIEVEKRRAADFREQFKAAADAGVEHPNKPALDKAAGLAKTKDEQSLVHDLQARISDFEQAKQNDRDTAFSAAGSALAADIDQSLTEKLLGENPASYEQAIGAFKSREVKVAAENGISPDLYKAQINSVVALLKQKQGMLEAARAEHAMLEQVRAALPLESRKMAIKAYLQRFPKSPRVADFQRVLQLAGQESALTAWGTITSKQGGNLVPASYQEAGRLTAVVQGYLKDHPDSPISAQVSAYLAYLRLGCQTVAPDGPWKKSFADLLKNPLVHDLGMLETKDGKLRYYTFGDPLVVEVHSTDGSVVGERFEAVTSPDLTKRQRIPFPNSDPPLLKADQPTPSPQALLANTELNRLAALEFPHWDSIGVQVIGDLVADQRINVVLRAILLQNALTASQSALDWAGEAKCKTVLKRLTDQNLDDVEWLNPEKPRPELVIQNINDAMRELPSIDVLREVIRKRQDQVLSSVPRRLVASGVLIKGVAGQNLDSGPIDGPAAAYAIDDAGHFVQVAHRDGTGWKFDSVALGSVPDGALLFTEPAGK